MALSEIALLKARIAKLEQAIADRDAKDYLLRLPTYWLGDVERKVAPGIETVMLQIIDRELKNAEEFVAKYGPNLRIIG
jgi:hypothetical protein